MTDQPSARLSASPARQLAGFIAKFDPAVARLVRSARSVLRKRFPSATEIVYDNYNALAIGYASTDRTSDVFVTLAVYARGVNLYFMYGAALPDPERQLKGNGNQGRFVPLETVAMLRTAAIDALIRAAVAESDHPLPKTGRGRTIVRSVSKKQRPRRPPRGRPLKVST